MASTPVASSANTPDAAPTIDQVVSAIRSVPGVHDLHGGALGEVATYLPGRRVAGLRMGENGQPWEIHLSLRWDGTAGLAQAAERVREAVRPFAGTAAVHVVIEDLVDASDPAPAGEVSEQPGR